MPRLWLLAILVFAFLPSGSASTRAQPASPEAPLASEAPLVLRGPSVVRVGEAATFRLTLPGETTDAVQFAWALGDGVEATGARVVHRYTATGTYALTARVAGRIGARSVQTTIRVLPAEPPSRSDEPLAVHSPLPGEGGLGPGGPTARGADARSLPVAPVEVEVAQAARSASGQQGNAGQKDETRQGETRLAVQEAAGTQSWTEDWTGEMWGGIAAIVALILVGITTLLRRRRQLRMQQTRPPRSQPDPTRPLRPTDAPDDSRSSLTPPMPPPPVLFDVTARRLQDACAFTRASTNADASTSPGSADSRTSERAS